jgi:hypothetical protein
MKTHWIKENYFKALLVSFLLKLHQSTPNKTMKQMSMYDQLIAKQPKKNTNSNFVIREFKSLNIPIVFYLPQTINIDFMKF